MKISSKTNKKNKTDVHNPENIPKIPFAYFGFLHLDFFGSETSRKTFACIKKPPLSFWTVCNRMDVNKSQRGTPSTFFDNFHCLRKVLFNFSYFPTNELQLRSAKVSNIDRILEVSNNLHPNLEFAIETHKDNSMPFLDMELRLLNWKIDTSWYQKPIDRSDPPIQGTSSGQVQEKHH